MSMKNVNDIIGNLTYNLPLCSAVFVNKVLNGTTLTVHAGWRFLFINCVTVTPIHDVFWLVG